MDFETECQQRKIDLSPQKIESFELLNKLFVQWNSKINLSAIRDEVGIWEKHLLDSILPCEWIDFADQKVLDLGAGGGFPTLPLAILYPTAQITALDSVGKKMKAVQDMADTMKLNVRALHGRIEDFGQDRDYRAKFDIVTARALAPWPVLLEYALPFVKVGGRFIAYQGPQIRSDLVEFQGLEVQLGGEIVETYATNLGDAERIFVVLEKIKPTPSKYPRENGMPRQKPLQ